jgi:hypothetical protein
MAHLVVVVNDELIKLALIPIVFTRLRFDVNYFMQIDRDDELIVSVTVSTIVCACVYFSMIWHEQTKKLLVSFLYFDD